MEGWAVWPARLYLRSVQQTTESECFVWEFGDCASRYALLVDRLSESEPALRLNLCSGLGVGILFGVHDEHSSFYITTSTAQTKHSQTPPLLQLRHSLQLVDIGQHDAD